LYSYGLIEREVVEDIYGDICFLLYTVRVAQFDLNLIQMMYNTEMNNYALQCPMT